MKNYIYAAIIFFGHLLRIFQNLGGIKKTFGIDLAKEMNLGHTKVGTYFLKISVPEKYRAFWERKY